MGRYYKKLPHELLELELGAWSFDIEVFLADMEAQAKERAKTESRMKDPPAWPGA